MAQTLDLANELQGLVVRNTFLDFPTGQSGGLDEPEDLPHARRMRAFSDMTDTKLPWKVPLTEDSSFFQITRHRISSDADNEPMNAGPGETPLSTVSEEKGGIDASPEILPPGHPLRNDPFSMSAYADALASGMPPLGSSLPGYPPSPWWYSAAASMGGTPPWAAQFPVWGGYSSFPPVSPHTSAGVTSLGQKDHEQAPRKSGKGSRKEIFESPLVSASEAGRRKGGGLGKGHKDVPAVPGAVGTQAKTNVAMPKTAQATQQKGAKPPVSPVPTGSPTTVMLRHIPNRYTSAQLVDLLNANGFKAKYDFVYLPMDFQNKVNLGYCFVNLCSHEVALRFQEAFNGYTAWCFDSSKASEVSWAQPYQGLEEHVERYRNSPVMHASMPLEYKPMIFKNGMQIPFPPPTRHIKAPKVRVHRERPTAHEA
eukprot:TRINITY_DN91598_c0_g1_i1.p1 TRINITY_DN91598_c0_g1~~TRINITY_DN91598_c0_g1_i1.p1  ORF type:complete len:425 (-),score=67.57 TRINITY_DN91598_c0_g1_i1:136-1410(-)